MSQIRVHPFFLSPNPSPSLLLDAQTPTLEQLTSGIEKPVQSEEEIDADIFDNLRTLWHGAPMKEIIDGLLNDQYVTHFHYPEFLAPRIFFYLLLHQENMGESCVSSTPQVSFQTYGELQYGRRRRK